MLALPNFLYKYSKVLLGRNIIDEQNRPHSWAMTLMIASSARTALAKDADCLSIPTPLPRQTSQNTYHNPGGDLENVDYVVGLSNSSMPLFATALQKEDTCY